VLVIMAAVAPDAAAIAALELREEEFKYIITVIVRLSQNQFEHLVSKGITVIEDLILLDEDSLIGFFSCYRQFIYNCNVQNET
jgi:transcriptional regulator NrdR family protein